jgi:threonine synthase
VVPAASGELYTKIWKGLKEFEDAGLIDKVKTRMHLAQPEGCSPIVEAFQMGSTQVRPVKPNTIAKSLAIGNPAAGPFALQTLADSGGTAVAALEEEVVKGISLLAETEGIFTETAGGVVISGLKRLVERGIIKSDEVTVAYITGNGLKTLEAVEAHPDWDLGQTLKEQGIIEILNLRYSSFADADQRSATLILKRVGPRETSVQFAPKSQTVVGTDKILALVKQYLSREVSRR